MKKLTLILLLVPSLVWGDELFVSTVRTNHFGLDYIPNEEHHAIGYEWGSYEAGIIDRNSLRKESLFFAYRKEFISRLPLIHGFRIAVATGYGDSVQPDLPHKDGNNDGIEREDGLPLNVAIQPSVFISKSYKRLSGEFHATYNLYAFALRLNL